MADSDNTASGGLLVVLGIIVALGAVYFFTQTSTGGSKSDITVRADIPNPGNNQ
jgi:hypothetical protein